MEIDKIDVQGMEKQRYNSIKESGEYLELNVLIGTENEKEGNGVTSKSPVVKTEFHKCGPKEVSCLYVVLQSILTMLEKEYPGECAAAKLCMTVDKMGSKTFVVSEEDEENKKED